MATITKLKSGNYRIRKHYKGKLYSCTIDHMPTKKEADRILFQIIEKDIIPSKLNMTFKQAAQYYIDLKRPVLSPSTIRGYTIYMKYFNNAILNRKINDFDNDYIQSIVNTMFNEGMSPKTIKNYIGFIITVLQKNRPDFIITITYPKKNKEEPYIPCDDDYSRLLIAASGTQYEIPLYLAGMGLRLSEICALTIDDIKDDGAYITKAKVRNESNDWVIREVNKTSTSCRFVPLSKDILELIKEKNIIYKGSPNSITPYIHRKAKELNIKDFSLHKLRHYFATKAHSLMIPDASIMKTGGWSTDHVMKSVYRHADKDVIKKDIKKLHDHFDTITEYKKDIRHENKVFSELKKRKHIALYFYLMEAFYKYDKFLKGIVTKP